MSEKRTLEILNMTHQTILLGYKVTPEGILLVAVPDQNADRFAQAFDADGVDCDEGDKKCHGKCGGAGDCDDGCRCKCDHGVIELPPIQGDDDDGEAPDKSFIIMPSNGVVLELDDNDLTDCRDLHDLFDYTEAFLDEFPYGVFAELVFADGDSVPTIVIQADKASMC